MIECFALFGMCIAVFIGIIGITALIGWINKDDDGLLKWLTTCVFYAVTVTLLINLLIK